MKGRNQLEWLGRLEQEQDNLRAALAWALESDHATLDGEELALRLSGALRRFWRMRGHFHEGRSWLTNLFSKARKDARRPGPRLSSHKASLLYAVGDVGAARPPAEESAGHLPGVGR